MSKLLFGRLNLISLALILIILSRFIPFSWPVYLEEIMFYMFCLAVDLDLAFSCTELLFDVVT